MLPPRLSNVCKLFALHSNHQRKSSAASTQLYSIAPDYLFSAYVQTVHRIGGVYYNFSDTDLIDLYLCSMESSELPHLPLGSQLSSGFNPHDVQSFQSFSPADIDHSLQAASNFVRIR